MLGPLLILFLGIMLLYTAVRQWQDPEIEEWLPGEKYYNIPGGILGIAIALLWFVCGD